MRDKVKVLFLAANPVDADTRLRIGEEIREIGEKISLGTLRDRLELVSEWAVRDSDLQVVLMRHKPDIVHFRGHGRRTSGIMLEDEDGNCKVVNKKALSDLFAILKDNVRVVVLNACYAKDQAQALTRTIDFTIGMNGGIEDRAAIVFAAHLYQSLAFGRSLKEAFDLAVNELGLEDIKGAYVPKLLVKPGADAAKFRIVKPVRRRVRPKSKPAASRDQKVAVGGDMVGAMLILGDNSNVTIGGQPVSGPATEEQPGKPRPVTLLSWLLAVSAVSLVADILRRFLGGGGWPDTAGIIIQPVLFALAAMAATLAVISLVRLARPPVEEAASSASVFRTLKKARRVSIAITITFVIALCFWLSLPAFARYYNERGVRFQYREQPDLTRALESYQKAVRLKPSYAQAHYNLAIALQGLQREEAIDEYILAIRYDSHIYPAHNNLARLYILRGKEGDYENALNVLSQAVDLSPQDENVQYSLNKNRGWANYKLGSYRQAEQDLGRAISLRKDKAAAHCLLAYVLKKLGKPGVADECFDCVRFAPGEKDIEATWVSDAQECLLKGDGK
jgi:tetratricopeptide (TPR) repeat protein